MEFTTEFRSGEEALIKFSKKSAPMLSGKVFTYNIKRIIENYFNIPRVRLLRQSSSKKASRYDFLDNYSSNREYIDESFLTRSDITGSEYLDKAIIAMMQFITMHTICRIVLNDYRTIYEKSDSYKEFINNYITYIREWCLNKSIKDDILSLVDEIDKNRDYLNSLINDNINIFSVIEDHDYVPNKETGNSTFYYIIFIIIAILIIFILSFYIIRKK